MFFYTRKIEFANARKCVGKARKNSLVSGYADMKGLARLNHLALTF